MNSDPQRRPAYEPLYDIDPETGGTVQVFYVGRRLAEFVRDARGWVVLDAGPSRTSARWCADGAVYVGLCCVPGRARDMVAGFNRGGADRASPSVTGSGRRLRDANRQHSIG